MLTSIDYSVTVPVPVDVAFRAFQNLDRLLHRGVYEKAAWTEGAPWQVGSRLQLVLVHPLRATISAVVATISPPRSVDLLGHALGITAEQHVSFGPDLRGGAHVRIHMNFIGETSEVPETDLQLAATFIAHDTLDTVAAYCEQRRANSAPGT